MATWHISACSKYSFVVVKNEQKIYDCATVNPLLIGHYEEYQDTHEYTKRYTFLEKKRLNYYYSKMPRLFCIIYTRKLEDSLKWSWISAIIKSNK
jgi:hypothetical protein